MNATKVDNLTDTVQAYLAEQVNSLPQHVTRKTAFEHFKNLGLPGNKHEEYRHTPITRALEKNFNFQALPSSTASFKGSIKEHQLADLDSYTIVVVNGNVRLELSTFPGQKGVTVSLLEDALKNNTIASEHFAKYADDKTDAFTAWNTTSWKSGLFIHVDRKVILDKPIVVYYLVDSSQQQVVNAIRNLIVIEQSGEATILQKFDSTGSNNHFTNIVTEAIIKENGGLNLYTIQDDNGSHYQYNQTHIHQANASRANAYTFTLAGKLIRNNLQLTLDGEGCESHMYGLYMVSGDTLVDNHTVADHQKPNSFSNELYKGIMLEKSKGVFNGKIYVRPNAQKTNAFQSNRNILLSEDATVNTKPQLEIWADDVKCSHGCTSGQLDEEAMFYLQTRGIAKEEARAMLLYAFAGEVLDSIAIDEIRSYLEKSVSNRLFNRK